ncbi:sulfite oxidase [soil metagenome]
MISVLALRSLWLVTASLPQGHRTSTGFPQRMLTLQINEIDTTLKRGSPMTKETTTMPFDKHTRLIVREREPFNAEPSPDLLRQAPITPNELFFVRNHAAVPVVDAVAYRLLVDGMVDKSLTLTLDDIKRAFPKRTVTATLQCAGNRREDFMKIEEIPGEVAWGADAISNAVWAGAALRDVLAAAGVHDKAAHAAFVGLDEVEKRNERFGFGGSIPLEKALNGEVLLAYEMNGEPLPMVHGFPLRAVVPGYIGARSVKWLERIKLQTEPSDNYYQAHAYKLFPPHVRAETADWENALTLGEQSLNAVICQPADGTTLEKGAVVIQGYAVAGGNRRVERVDVSIDGGETWKVADWESENQNWAWRFWQARIELPPGAQQIVVRAWDSAANTQPEDARHIWNFKGYMNNAWHRVNVIQK